MKFIVITDYSKSNDKFEINEVLKTKLNSSLYHKDIYYLLCGRGDRLKILERYFINQNIDINHIIKIDCSDNLPYVIDNVIQYLFISGKLYNKTNEIIFIISDFSYDHLKKSMSELWQDNFLPFKIINCHN